MREDVVVRTGAETLPETERAPAHRILSGDVERNGPFWASSDRGIDSGNWNELATENEIHPIGFSILPKTILGLPSSWQRPYRRFYERIHAFLHRHVPAGIQAVFCLHYDVVARA